MPNWPLLTLTVLYLLSGVSKVFLLARLDRCGLCRGCEWVWFWALSKWSSVSRVRCTWGVLLHLSPLLQWPLVQPALWPLWPPSQSVPAKLHLPNTLQWNSLLQMPSWWVNTSPQLLANSAFFSPLWSVTVIFFFNRLLYVGNTLKKAKNTIQKSQVKHIHNRSKVLARQVDEEYSCHR